MTPAGRPTRALATHLREYRSAATGVPVESRLIGTRIRAITAAADAWLNRPFVASASHAGFRGAVRDFYHACVRADWHATSIDRHADRVRRGMAHLVEGPSPEGQLDQFLTPFGEFFVPGLGPAFWSAAVQALAPGAAPAWTPDVVAGLNQFGVWLPGGGTSPAVFYAGLQLAYAEIRKKLPGLTAFHVDEFLTEYGLQAPPATVDRWVNQYQSRRGRGRLSFAAGRGLARLDDAIARVPVADRYRLAEQAVRSFAASHGLSRAGAVAVLEAVADDRPGQSPDDRRPRGAEVFGASWFRRRVGIMSATRRPSRMT